MMKRALYILIVLAVGSSLFFASCSELAMRRAQGVVAEYEGKQLREQDLRSLTKGLSAVDSVRAVENFIRQWCVDLQMEKVVGKESMGRTKLEIERLVDDYRRSLYAYEWEQYLVAREMPQHVVDTVIVSYYETNKDRLILRETILRGVLLVVPTDAPGLDKVKQQISKLPKLDGVKDVDEVLEILEGMEKYAYQYGSGYELFLDEWKTASQVLSRMPIREENLRSLLKQKRQVSLQDSLNTYVLQVSEMYLPGDRMPLDYARGEIEKVILTQRQVEFIEQKREELYNNALEQGKLKIYEK